MDDTLFGETFRCAANSCLPAVTVSPEAEGWERIGARVWVCPQHSTTALTSAE